MAEEKEIERRVEMAGTLIAIQKDIHSTAKITDKIYETLHGNGKEGLVTTVALISQSSKNNKKSIGRIWKAGGSVIGGSGGIAIILKLLGVI